MGINICDIGKRLRMCRRDADMTQEELAEKLGYTSRTSISRVEKGEAEMPLSKLARCADIFGVELSVLVYGESREPDTIEKKIGARIRQARKSADLTQMELAKKLGYTNQTTIARIEAGTNEIPVSKLIDCADILNVDVVYLLVGR